MVTASDVTIVRGCATRTWTSFQSMFGLPEDPRHISRILTAGCRTGGSEQPLEAWVSTLVVRLLLSTAL